MYVFATRLGLFFESVFLSTFFFFSKVGREDTLWEHIWDKADHMRNSHVFGPMVHELFNEDLGILTRQLKEPYGLQQLLAMTSERTWSSKLRAVSATAPLYGGDTPKCSENMHHQTLCVSSPIPPEPNVWLNHFPLLPLRGTSKNVMPENWYRLPLKRL